MEEEGREGGVQAQAVNLDCPNTASPAARCLATRPHRPCLSSPPLSLSHGGRRLRNFTRTLLARTEKFQGSPDAVAAVAACGGDSYVLQWAQGKAGENRVQVVVSEERGWVFIGIYDGFNGPDATDFLISNLYAAVHRELRGLLWEQQEQEQQQDQRRDEPSSTTPSTTA